MASADEERRSPAGRSLQSLRLSAAHLQRWVLLDGSRYGLAAVVVAVGFLLFAWLGYSGILDVGRTTTPLLYLFSALAGGNITLITIVVTINQLILSRELRSPREVQMELESAEQYRESVEEETGRRGVPERPDEFLDVLVADTKRQVTALESTLDAIEDPALEDELDELTSQLDRELEETLGRLQTSHDDLFSALSTILDADFSTRLNHSRWLRQSYGERLSEPQVELLDDLEGRIEQLDVARQYFKTIYIKQELADVSKLVMYTGLVATLVAIGVLVVVGYAESPPGFTTRLVVVPLAVAVNLVPLALLVTHVVRITTVARRTAAITPFISPSA